MTLFELLIPLIWIGLGIVAGVRVGGMFSATGAWIGGCVGAGFQIGTLWVFHRLLRIGEDQLPRCRCGATGPEMFSWVEDKRWGWVERCNCGKSYLKRGGLFWYEALEDGTARLFMKRNSWRKWIDASEADIKKRVLKPGKFERHTVVWRVKDRAVTALRAAKGRPEAVREAVLAYLREGSDVGLSPSELTDYFCVSTPSVVEMAGYTGAAGDAVVAVFDEVHDEFRRNGHSRAGETA